MMNRVGEIPALRQAFLVQQEAADAFYNLARDVLRGIVALSPVPPSLKRFERNFFSSLFLATLRALGLAPGRQPVYGLVTQCMRAWVTGCDNILDGDDRLVLPLDLPGEGYRFKNVLVIMATDRVLSEALRRGVAAGEMSADYATRLERLSLACLAPSGFQEHEEEGGIHDVLDPDALLERVHGVKTGRLFQAPVAVAEGMGEISGERVATALRGLHAFGLGCQILDDMADVRRDLVQARHNYVVAVFGHGASDGVLEELRRLVDQPGALTMRLDDAMRQAGSDARRRIEEGLRALVQAGLPLDAEEQGVISAALFPLLLNKDAYPRPPDRPHDQSG